MSQIRLECHSALMELFRKIRKLRKKNFCDLGIIPSHFFILRYLKPGDALTISELSCGVKMESSNIISIIDCFEEKGYLQRQRDAEDRRIVRVTLTHDGERYREDMISRHEEFIVGLYKALEEEEIKRFTDIIRLVHTKIYEGDNWED